MAKENKNKAELMYYLTLYTLEGHTRWRAHLGQDEGAFDRMWTSNLEGKKPKITSKSTVCIDRLTGTFKA